MLTRLSSLTTRRPKRVLLATLAFLVLAVAFGAPVGDHMSTGDDFVDPGSQSAHIDERLERAAGAETAPSAVALIRPASDRARVRRVTEALEDDPAVARVAGYANTKDRAFLSKDGRSTYVAAFLRSGVDDEAAVSRLQDTIEPMPGVQLGGDRLAFDAVGDQVSEDLARAELLAFPLLFLLSLWAFRGLVASLLPLFVGAITVMGTFLALRVVNEAQLLSVFALNLGIGLGLGLAIDYSLFVVSRFREELARGADPPKAIAATLQTAGRTVIFSSATVALALLSLTIFPMRFLYSMGIAGATTAIVAAIVSLTALPALLAVLGRRVDALAPKRWQRAREAEARAERSGFWYRLSWSVMRRPLPVALLATGILVAVGIPALSIKFTGVDASILPGQSSPAQVDAALREDFPPTGASPLIVAVRAPREERTRVAALAEDLADLPGAAAAVSARPVGDGLWQIDLVPEGRPFDDASKDLVTRIRDGSFALPVAGVAGQSARFSDQQSALVERLPLAVLILAVSTLVLLFAMTGSVVLPLKALLMNVLTLTAAFGVLVLIFQDGRLEGVLDYTTQNAIESTQPLVLLAVAFGLSTDYGVFLLTRIKEAHERGVGNEEAVAIGIQRTGRIVTAAALLFCVAIGAFATSEIIFIKEVGIGTAAAVLIDATIVRALLVPALMRLLGERNWWAPRPLRRLHERFGLSEEAPSAA